VQPLFYALAEIEAGASVDVTLERYAEVDPGFVRAYGGAEFPPAFHAIDGGRP
jgi:hypothetical protein